MKTLTVRMADRDYDELASVAASRGTTLSELARETLAGLTRVPEEARRGPTEAPTSLDVVTRHQLALLHKILAHVVEDPGGDGNGHPDELNRAQVLELGYVEEYDNEFSEIEPELSRRESNWVIDVLVMFEELESSFHSLTEAERANLGQYAEHSVTFGGFDMNDRLERRLLGYAQHLINQGRFESLARHFTRDGGNSRMERYDVYDRMLEVFRPLSSARRRGASRNFDPKAWQFTADEISRVIAAGNGS
jgi:uncharacterized protein YfbU (UPF0304 family)